MKDRSMLAIVDEVFGPGADLYNDVLGVKSQASSEEIQNAYFDRRSELLRLLADLDAEQEEDSITASHRFHAERKIDAVVMAVRILGDPARRKQYDDMRLTRVRRSGDRALVLAKAAVSARSTPKSQTRPMPLTRISPQTEEEDEDFLDEEEEDDDPAEVAKDLDDNDDDEEDEEEKGLDRRQQSNGARDRTRYSRRAIAAALSANMESQNILNLSLASAPPKLTIVGTAPSPPIKPASPKRKARWSQRAKVVTPPSNQATEKRRSRHQQPPVVKPRQYEPQQQQQQEPPKISILRNPPLIARTTPPTSYVVDENTEDTTVSEENDESYTARVSRSTRDDASTDSSVVSLKGHSMLGRVRDEIIGAIEDTSMSFEQVFNVFTLQENDILAVMGRIDKAKRQIIKRL